MKQQSLRRCDAIVVLFALATVWLVCMSSTVSAGPAPAAPATSATAQIAHDITILETGTNTERNGAVADICKQPLDQAATALKAARAAEKDEDIDWWLDAASQAVGRAALPPADQFGSTLPTLGADAGVTDAAQ